MNRYLQLIKVNTPYAVRMNRLRNRIFGDHFSYKKNQKPIRVIELFREQPIYKKREVINYYPKHREIYELIMTLRNYGLYRDEHADFEEEMEARRCARGKGKKHKPSRTILT